MQVTELECDGDKLLGLRKDEVQTGAAQVPVGGERIMEIIH